MPYIITTRRETGRMTDAGWQYDDSRRAVVTLDDARLAAYGQIISAEPDGEWWDDHRMSAHSIPEAGGTIGPLPDGTVIEVQPATYGDLIVALGTVENRYRVWLTNVQVINAYNAYNAQQERAS